MNSFAASAIFLSPALRRVSFGAPPALGVYEAAARIVRWAGVAVVFALSSKATAQAVPWATTFTPAVDAAPLPEDRGADGLAQTLAKLRTWGSLMMIVAHPDDEDGGMMAFESRGAGIRTTLLTLTRGEGGQNAISGEVYDALGLIRTNELLLADRYSGTEQLWGTEADYGFSKTKEEAFTQWGRERVVRDVVRAVRAERPLVLASVFVGGITDGHGHHQIAGELAQEAFNLAGDPAVYPELGRPWKPLAVFAREPFAPVTAQGMYDYATDTWAPISFTNWVTGARTAAVPSADVEIPEGRWDPVLGRSYLQMAREGWGLQKSQNGGGNPPLAGPATVRYHRYGSRVTVPPGPGGFFAGMDVSLPGLASLAGGAPAPWLADGLRKLDSALTHASLAYTPAQPRGILTDLLDAARTLASLLAALDASSLPANNKADLRHELAIKQVQLNTALAEVLGLRLDALVTPAPPPGKGRKLDIYPELARAQAVPGESLDVRVRVTADGPWAAGDGDGLRLAATSLRTPPGEPWQVERLDSAGLGRARTEAAEVIFRVAVPRGARPTEPYFSRPSIEQAFYDLTDPALAGQSYTPYPVSASAEFHYDGVPIRLAEVVQGVERERGPGTQPTPLVVVPGLSVTLPQRVAVLPRGKRTLDVEAVVENEKAEPAEAVLRLQAPAGWEVSPAAVTLALGPGERARQTFTLTAPANPAKAALEAVATSGNDAYRSGFTRVGYGGLRRSNLFQAARMEVHPVDVAVAPGARVLYIAGTGDTVPEALRALGIPVDTLAPAALPSADLRPYSAIMLGVRTYTAAPSLAESSPALRRYAEEGGTVVVQYQSADFPGLPYPVHLGSSPAKVVDERSPVTLLDPNDPLLTAPNRITAADFDGWVEERGHGFAASWARAWKPLVRTADPGQAPQAGGLLVAPVGKGRYVYLALALYRQLPEGVEGAYRLLANLASGKAGWRVEGGG